MEESLGLNKASLALLMATSVWVIRSAALGAAGHAQLTAEVSESLGEVSEVIFFLIGAMTIVETVDAHQVSKQAAAPSFLHTFLVSTLPSAMSSRPANALPCSWLCHCCSANADGRHARTASHWPAAGSTLHPGPRALTPWL